jgi:O-methyltransferase involved in polyketide biosynthesis
MPQLHVENDKRGNDRPRLAGVQETLFITLFAKGRESLLADSLLCDERAAAAIERIDYDFAKLKIRRDMMVGLAMRAHTLDRWTRDFLARHPRAVVLHLGCGLDTRVHRVNPPSSVQWFDVDFPEVIDLRRQLYPEREGHTLVASSVMRSDWLHAIPKDLPTMIVAEGLFPYLGQEEVPRLLGRLVERLPSGELAFDGYSRWGVQLLKMVPAIRATGAKVGWAINDPLRLVSQVPRLRFVEELTDHDPAQLARMTWPSRLAVSMMSAVPALRRVARLLRFEF